MATISREDKLKLSAEAGYGHAFRQGLFSKLYEQSLWRFIHQVRHLKPMLERVKGGGPVILRRPTPILMAMARLVHFHEAGFLQIADGPFAATLSQPGAFHN